MHSIVWTAQRCSRSYTEKRRWRREIEETRRRRGGIKSGERNLASNHFHMCSPQSGSLRDVHRVTQRREEGGREETEVARRIKGGIKRRETDPVNNQFPKFSPPSRAHTEIHRIG